MKRILLGLLITCLTTACGWQLRGSSSMPHSLERLYLVATDAHGELATQLRQQLLTHKVVLTEKASDAPLSLYVLEEQIDRRTAAVGADALTSAYELFMTATYEVRDNAGQLIAPRATASITRTYNYNANDATSSSREESLLLKEMRRDLAQQLVRRVNALNSDRAKRSSATESVDAKTAP